MKRQTPFPIQTQKKQKLELKPSHLLEQANDDKIQQHSWLTDGTIKPIEEGLPVIGNPSTTGKKPHIETFVEHLIEKPYLKEFDRIYGHLTAGHPEYDMRDPDNMTQYEKQLIAQYSTDAGEQMLRQQTIKVRDVDVETGKIGSKLSSKISPYAHLFTWGGAIPYYESHVFDPEEIIQGPVVHRQTKRTGIYGEPRKTDGDKGDLVREINYQSVPKSEVEEVIVDDPVNRPLRLENSGFRSHQATGVLPRIKNDTTVKDCMKRFFDPEVGLPFVPADVGKYFPLDILTPPSPAKTERSVRSVYENPEDDCDPETTLLKTDQEDLLFTKSKAPFTRTDIARVRAFSTHFDKIKDRQQKRAQKKLQKRHEMIEQAFHSRAVFETYLKLVEEDCKRINSGVLGKSPYKKKSMWQVALETAPPDTSSLDARRVVWYRVAAWVREVGGLKEEYDTELVQTIRAKLMLCHPIDKSLFWDVIQAIKPGSLENVATLRIIEFLRIVLDVDQQEFEQYLLNQNVSLMIYNQTIVNSMTRETIGKMNPLAKGPIDVEHIK